MAMRRGLRVHHRLTAHENPMSARELVLGRCLTIQTALALRGLRLANPWEPGGYVAVLVDGELRTVWATDAPTPPASEDP